MEAVVFAPFSWRRHDINHLIWTHPGISFVPLVNKMRLGPDCVRHHVRMLVRDRDIVSRVIGREIHFVPRSLDVLHPEVCETLIRIRHGTAAYVLREIVANPGLHFNELQRRLRMNPQALSFWLDFLVQSNLAAKKGRYLKRLYSPGPAFTRDVHRWLLNDQLLGFPLFV